MSETAESKEKTIPEPPKFNIEDLPEPPRIDKPEPKVPLPSELTTVIPPPVQETKLNKDLLDALPPPPPQEKGGIFSKLFGKKKKEEKIEVVIPKPKEEKIDLAPVNDESFAPPKIMAPVAGASEPVPPAPKLSIPEPPAMIPQTPATQTKDDELVHEAEDFKEKEMLEEGEHYIDAQAKDTPIAEVKGVGPTREKKLKKAGIKTAQHLASHKPKELAKIAKIPESHAKEIISNAKKITQIRQRLKETKVTEEKGISTIVKELEEERKSIEKLQKGDISEDKIIQLEGHKDIVHVLENLEKKRRELTSQEEELAQKEIKLASHDEVYRRDIEHIENLRRRLDHDIRERTQYLINLEKEYFQKAQTLAKKQSEVEVKEKEFTEKEKYYKQKETELKLKANEVEDRSLTLQTKEQKYEKLAKDLDRQDTILREKEDDLMKREEEYLKKLSTLETHEKAVLKELEERRRKLEAKEKEIELREKRINTKERTVDKKSVAMEYAQNILEEEKSKLVDDEFEQYLHEQLGMLKNTGINIDDMNFVKNIPTGAEHAKNIYQLMDTCKDLVRNSRVTEAKVFYNQVREKYYSTNFATQKEKEAVHNMLRSLYDEINLADIGSNR